MHEIIALKLAAAGKMAASLIPAAIPIALAEVGVIGENTGLSLVIVGSVVGGAWYLNGRLTRIEDGVSQLKRDMRRLPCGDGKCGVFEED
jgi:hypothetical protein